VVILYYLSELSPKDSIWDKRRSLTQDFETLYDQAGYKKESLRLHKCAHALEYAREVLEDGTSKMTLHTARFCRVRGCPTCQWRRSLGWMARIIKSYPRIQAEYPTARWIEVTLTCSNCPVFELRSTIDHLNKSFRKLTLRKDFPGIGWVKAIEVTNNDPRPGYAHPHIHALLLVPAGYFSGLSYLNSQQWRDIWQECLKQLIPPSIKVKAVKHKDPDALFKALVHTIKYVTDFDDDEESVNNILDDVDWFREYVKQMHNVRNVSIGGVLRGKISNEEITDQEMIGENSEPLNSPEQWKFYWKSELRKYMGDHEG
jgi:plasmid rolling circle replication initiator protein Rep